MHASRLFCSHGSWPRISVRFFFGFRSRLEGSQAAFKVVGIQTTTDLKSSTSCAWSKWPALAPVVRNLIEACDWNKWVGQIYHFVFYGFRNHSLGAVLKMLQTSFEFGRRQPALKPIGVSAARAMLRVVREHYYKFPVFDGSQFHDYS